MKEFKEISLLTSCKEQTVNRRNFLTHEVYAMLADGKEYRCQRKHEQNPKHQSIFRLNKMPKERAQRIAHFLMETQIERRDTQGLYTSDKFVLRVMGWRTFPRYDDNPCTEKPQPGEPYSIINVKGSVRFIESYNKHTSVLGLDGTANVLFVPGMDAPLEICRVNDLVKSYGKRAYYGKFTGDFDNRFRITYNPG